MDEKYIIECINGPCYANVIPIQEVVWAHKTVTQVNAVIKTNTSLILHYANHKGGTISISETAVDYILQQFMEKHREIVVGYNREVGKTLLKRGYGGSQRICPSAAYWHTRRLIWFASSKIKELYLNRKKSPH